jgi:acylphosphatase
MPAPSEISERFEIIGDVGAPVFARWIVRHARRLGLSGAVLAQGPGQIDLVATGQADLLDALALGCSLGPQEVWVDRINRLPGIARGTDEFSSYVD